MKKIILVVLCVLITVSAAPTTYAETSIEGFRECYDKLWLNYYEDIGIKENMIRSYDDYRENDWKRLLTAPDYARSKMGLSGTLEEQEAQYYHNTDLDYDNGFAVWVFDDTEYLLQYSNVDLSEYLIYANNYWLVPYKDYVYSERAFKTNGERYPYGTSSGNEENLLSMGSLLSLGREYLKNVTRIEDELIYEGITLVNDMKIIILDFDCTVLYIKTNVGEYFIRLYYHDYYKWAPEFEKFKLYKASEALQLIADSTGEMSEVKETFEEEAIMLQNEGLLKGTDNGLDLLKPLTRIEAVTMLLRAIGEENFSASAQIFDDVPDTHWGCTYAAKARELGIVNGVGDNLFAPDKRVTAEEFSTMVLRASQNTNFEWTEALNILVSDGILKESDTEDMSLFTRGDMAKIIYEARNKGLLR